jgi:hypothetical protein
MTMALGKSIRSTVWAVAEIPKTMHFYWMIGLEKLGRRLSMLGRVRTRGPRRPNLNITRGYHKHDFGSQSI